LLDEVGEFPLALQPKLLRVLENGEYYRVGETRPRIAKARIIAATNRDLLEEIRAGNFRHDLYHRISVLTIDVPPLRERGADCLLLMEHFRALYAEKVPPFVLDEQGAERWSRYTFPGNVRELRNIVIRLGAKHPGAHIGLTELEAEFDGQSQVDGESIQELTAGGFRLDEILSSWEQRYIEAALKLADGNLSEAARLLGVNRTTLYSKIQRLKGGPDSDV
jgi:DNA-binding NtrC family response regulator